MARWKAPFNFIAVKQAQCEKIGTQLRMAKGTKRNCLFPRKKMQRTATPLLSASNTLFAKQSRGRKRGSRLNSRFVDGRERQKKQTRGIYYVCSRRFLFTELSTSKHVPSSGENDSQTHTPQFSAAQILYNLYKIWFQRCSQWEFHTNWIASVIYAKPSVHQPCWKIDIRRNHISRSCRNTKNRPTANQFNW